MTAQLALTLPAPAERFDGATIHADDVARLTGQMLRVWRVLKGHEGSWLTLSHIAQEAGCPEASASARLRDARKMKWGGHNVERQRRPGGCWVYRLNDQKLQEAA